MVQQQLVKVLTGIALLVAGMVAILAGLLISIFTADGSWLFVSLVGFISVIGGVLLVINQMHRALGYVKKQYNKSHAKKLHGSRPTTDRPVKHIKHD